MMKQGLKSLLFIFTIYLAIGIISTLPLILQLKERIIGMIDHPGLQGELFFQYNIFFQAKKGNLFHWFITDLVNYPKGQNLGPAIANSLHLFFSLPIQIFLGLIPSYNILVLITLTLNGLAMYVLAKYFLGSGPVAFSSGLFFMLNTYNLLKLNQGFLQKVTLLWIPLYFLYLFRLKDIKKPKYIFLSGLCLFLTQWTYGPYAYYAILFTIFLVIYDILKTKRSLCFARDSFLSLSIFFVLTFILWYSQNYKIFPWSLSSNSSNLSFNGCLDIFRIFRFYPYYSESYLTHLPLGISIIGLMMAIFVFFKERGFPRFIFITTLIFVIISMGPYLSINGKPLELIGHRIVLPYYLLFKYLPYGWRLIFPIRIFPILNICLALLIGYALTNLTNNKKIKPILACFLFIFLYIFETRIVFHELFPPVLSKIEIPEFYEKIKDEKFGAILNLPLRSDRKAVNLYCYYAALSDKKIINPYDRAELPIAFPKNKDDWNEQRQFIAQLAKWGVRYIVIHKKLFKTEPFLDNFLKDTAWIKSFYGSPEDYAEDGILVYRIPTYEEQKSYNGRTIYVPVDQATIQGGIDFAQNGDMVIVAPGRYYENINFKGKAITVKSEKGVDATIIDGNRKSSVVTFNSREGENSILDGFTICNGRGVWDGRFYQGGGIYCDNSSPTIINNVIKDNIVDNGGGILCLNHSSPEIKNNIIIHNTAVKGGGIRCSDFSSPKIINNIIMENDATRLGGGIYWRVNSHPKIIDNLIINNKSGEYGGGLFGSGSAPTISNCLIWGNISPLGSQIGFGYLDIKINISNTIIEPRDDAIYDPYNVLDRSTTQISP